MVKIEQKLDLVCIGRSSVDLYGEQVGGRLEDMASFAKYVGGSPTNISIGSSRLGLKTALITKVGDEHMGRFIIEQLEREKVDISQVKIDPERLTALVLLGIRNQHQFPLIFFRENCADMAITPEDISRDFIASSKATLVTGTHFSKTNVSEASFLAMKYAKDAGRRVVFDIDYRPNLWTLGSHNDGENRFEESDFVTNHIRKILPFCDLVIGTEEEWKMAGGSLDTLQAIENARRIFDGIIVCKRGALGCTIFDDTVGNWENGITISGKEIEVFNVLGAGDGFMSGFLYGWLNNEKLEKCGEYANACGALTVSRHGCAPAYPSEYELKFFINTGSPEFSLRHDIKLEQIHRSTTRRKTYPKLYTFAFDHRKQFEQFRSHDNPSKTISGFKLLALEAVIKMSKMYNSLGIIVDNQYGQEALFKAADHNLWVGRPIEKSGIFPLQLDCDCDLSSFLREWPKTQTIKLLAPMRTDDPRDIFNMQRDKVLEVAAACRSTGHEFLLEIINSRNDQQPCPKQIIQIMTQFYEMKVYPDWWKLEPIDDSYFWKSCGDLIRTNDPFSHGIVILGKEAPVDILAKTFQSANEEPLVKGFAVGRSIFADIARLWFKGEVSDEKAASMMANGLANLIIAWEKAREK